MDLKKPTKTKRADLRFTEEQYNRIQGLADLYAGGNFNLWVTWASINGPRKFITKADLLPKRRKRRIR